MKNVMSISDIDIAVDIEDVEVVEDVAVADIADVEVAMIISLMDIDMVSVEDPKDGGGCVCCGTKRII